MLLARPSSSALVEQDQTSLYLPGFISLFYCNVQTISWREKCFGTGIPKLQSKYSADAFICHEPVVITTRETRSHGSAGCEQSAASLECLWRQFGSRHVDGAQGGGAAKEVLERRRDLFAFPAGETHAGGGGGGR